MATQDEITLKTIFFCKWRISLHHSIYAKRVYWTTNLSFTTHKHAAEMQYSKPKRITRPMRVVLTNNITLCKCLYIFSFCWLLLFMVTQRYAYTIINHKMKTNKGEMNTKRQRAMSLSCCSQQHVVVQQWLFLSHGEDTFGVPCLPHLYDRTDRDFIAVVVSFLLANNL